MKFIIQRVTHASCKVEGKIVGEIDGNGFCVFIGVAEDDTKEIADKLIRKMLGLRIFADENDKTNLSLHDVDGSLLLISQFTLYANCKKGFRPSFDRAGNPKLANELYEYIIAECKKEIPIVETGCFGEHMEISLNNHGPFTIILDSAELINPQK
ncbi:MAG: D-tyrosyl-tRNA(Tyr) deacylase [Agathobacter sp.]|uniref:D-aminoacyl-tRNA deacylase n=1 Tax=Agathobacter sp. TaxID=2021311 RepID=UPI0004E0E049|nr:D-aminoacyl-tRNA deacylase [Agathobacter sp.]MBQ1682534.1 D-tyrosyl-tRNA(Tyr) deacylase [Agathobacter sp.]MCR5677429.1 D-tyrosyl-tRNA(Tyr) deacylase [Agathobacter sp.]